MTQIFLLNLKSLKEKREWVFQLLAKGDYQSLGHSIAQVVVQSSPVNWTVLYEKYRSLASVGLHIILS